MPTTCCCEQCDASRFQTKITGKGIQKVMVSYLYDLPLANDTGHTWASASVLRIANADVSSDAASGDWLLAISLSLSGRAPDGCPSAVACARVSKVARLATTRVVHGLGGILLVSVGLPNTQGGGGAARRFPDS